MMSTRTRPRTLDLYGMYYDTRSKGEKQHKGTTPNNWGDPFDMSNLSSAYGPRTTETLIEAIFNPVPSHSERVSPVTYFVPLEHQGGKASPVSARSGNSDRRDRNGSVHSAATSSEYTDSVKTRSISSRSGHSLSSHGHSSEFGGGGGEEEKHRPWWRKIGTGSVGCSRPGTPCCVKMVFKAIGHPGNVFRDPLRFFLVQLIQLTDFFCIRNFSKVLSTYRQVRIQNRTRTLRGRNFYW